MCVEGIHRDKMNDYFKEFKGIKLSALRDVVLRKKSDDKFQRAYMLFALGCFLCPTQKDVVSRLFPGVVTDEMEKIKRYKWPEFVLNWLVEEIRNYKIKASKGPSCSAQGVGGALFILMAPIKAYHDEIHAFLKRLKNLHKWDDDLSMLRDVQVRSLDDCERLGGKRLPCKKAPNEPDVQEVGGEKMANVMDFLDDNNQSPHDKDVTPKEGQVHETPVC
ncbi:hypothetical protein Vadar_020594 [Vaccinium darrowii]|uniref:Uncharacterized protein n=1 Tax=Vaccinium darrowii TaxID=229202 RepID=A0ACB7XJ74_9ERIC|nr:hypothetical protein Vadar_020594 [Vaccinium darrowii]